MAIGGIKPHKRICTCGTEMIVRREKMSSGGLTHTASCPVCKKWFDCRMHNTAVKKG
jgi:hypothetical protein